MGDTQIMASDFSLALQPDEVVDVSSFEEEL